MDLSSLRNAVKRLEEGLSRYQQDIRDTQIRDGLIQRFEFTYEISHKLLKRFLESSAANPEEYDKADFQYLIRSANEQGLLLGSWTQWKDYREMRSKTSHTYDEETALQVVKIIPDFLKEAEHLLKQFEARVA